MQPRLAVPVTVFAGVLASVLALAGRIEAAAAGTLSVTVLQENGKPLPGAVVTVHFLDGVAKPSPPIHAVMDQVNQAFTPDLLVIPVGSTVSFPNSDTTSHEVYSFSPAHPFQLPLYRGKPYPPQHFDKVGLVTLGCNIHDYMLAYILVTDGQFYGRTDARGVWSATEVPHGRYRIEIWHPRLPDRANQALEVAVSDKEPAETSMHLEHPLRPAPLGERLPSWDSY